jgi:acetyltransferase-like isoleucine patch superfamily enzyme
MMIMIKQFFKIIALFNFVFNWFVFKSQSVKYLNFPQIYGIIVVRGNGLVEFGENVKINSQFTMNPVGLSQRSAFFAMPNAVIKIGNNVGISNSLIYARQLILIEDNVLIGGGCQILDSDFHSIRYTDRIEKGDCSIISKPIIIKRGAFIGASCIILKGITIGERCIIAAGSIVTKSVPPDEIWGGNPAIFIKKI